MNKNNIEFAQVDFLFFNGFWTAWELYNNIDDIFFDACNKKK